MSYATVSDVRNLISTSLTDTEIEQIISLAEKWIDGELTIQSVSSSGSASSLLTLASAYKAAAIIANRARTDGDLPDSLSAGDLSQKVDVSELVEHFEKEAEKYLKLYIKSTSSYRAAIKLAKYDQDIETEDDEAD